MKFSYCKDHTHTLQVLLISTHLIYKTSKSFYTIFSEKSFVILTSAVINWKNKPGKHEHVTVLSSHTRSTKKPGIYFEFFAVFFIWRLVNLRVTCSDMYFRQSNLATVWRRVDDKIGGLKYKLLLRDMAIIQIWWESRNPRAKAMISRVEGRDWTQKTQKTEFKGLDVEQKAAR